MAAELGFRNLFYELALAALVVALLAGRVGWEPPEVVALAIGVVIVAVIAVAVGGRKRNDTPASRTPHSAQLALPAQQESPDGRSMATSTARPPLLLHPPSGHSRRRNLQIPQQPGPQPGVVCDSCKLFFNWVQAADPATDERFFQYSYYRAWEAGRAQGCELCWFLYRLCLEDILAILQQNRWPVLYWYVSSSEDFFVGPKVLEITAWIKAEDQMYDGIESFRMSSGDFTMRVNTFAMRFVRITAEQDALGGYTTSHTASSAVWLGLARHWLHTCIHKHQHCGRPRAQGREGWEPTRLIYVGGTDDALRLVEGAEIPRNAPYATLSHCWGTATYGRVELTMQTLAQFKAKLPPLSHVKTLQDAVHIARLLGIPYLWIDSLCILQDSQADWRHEAALMGEVYKNALFNISATAATDDTGSCFSHGVPSRKTPSQEKLRVEFMPTTTSAGLHRDGPAATDPTACRPPLGIRVPTRADSRNAMLGSYHLVSKVIFGGWRQDVEEGAVNKRGWVLQERLLAPRILHFSWTQLYWECAQLSASGMFPFGFPDDVVHHDRAPIKALSPFNLDAHVRKDGPLFVATGHIPTFEYKKALFGLWGNIVAKYCGTRLTQETDRLVALSAVAKEMKRLLRSRYLAGLWETDLILQLPWRYAIWTSENQHEHDPYVAPSWSWASVKGAEPRFHEMYTNTKGYQPLLEILDAHVELAGPDETGQVKGGHLTVRGAFIGLVHRRGSYEIFINGQSCDRRVHVSVSGDWATSPVLNTGPQQSFLCLPVYATWEASLFLRALLLERVGREGGFDVFRRVGLVEYEWNWSDGTPPAPIVEAIGRVVRNGRGDAVAFQQDAEKLSMGRIV